MKGVRTTVRKHKNEELWRVTSWVNFWVTNLPPLLTPSSTTDTFLHLTSTPHTYLHSPPTTSPASIPTTPTPNHIHSHLHLSRIHTHNITPISNVPSLHPQTTSTSTPKTAESLTSTLHPPPHPPQYPPHPTPTTFTITSTSHASTRPSID